MKAGTTGQYSIYRRKIGETTAGKPVRAWYYRYLADDGVQVRRSCGTAKVPCLLRGDAEAFIARLEAEARRREDAAADEVAAARAVRLRDVATTMYRSEGNHMRLRVERGEHLSDITMAECRAYLDRWILPRFGDRIPATIDGAEIEDWLIEQDRSNSWRNRVLEVFGEVFGECLRYKLVAAVPVVKRFRRPKLKRDVLVIGEIEQLFPDDPRELAAVWTEPDPREPAGAGLMFGSMLFLMLSTGIRLGEACAVRPSQLDRERSGLILDQSFDTWHRVNAHLKAGDEDDPRLRCVIVPKRAQRALDWWMEESTPRESGDLLFQYRGRPVRREHVEARFDSGLRRAGIRDVDARRLTPHALRYTYNTRMSRLIPGDPLRLMMGHKDEEMTRQYTRAELLAQLDSLQRFIPAIEQLYA